MYHIIAEKLKGKLSPEKEIILSEWLEKSKDNERLFKEIENTWKITWEAKHDIITDVDKELERFQSFRKSNTSPLDEVFKPKSVRYIPFPAKIAAAVILLFFLTVGIYKTWLDHNKYVTIETRIETKTFSLPDGTQITLSQNSELTYKANYTVNNRNVRLEGEASFRVAKNNVPFIIKTWYTETKVLGTVFNLKAYPSGEKEELTVTAGKVSFGARRSKERAIISAGQYAEYNPKTKTIVTGILKDTTELSNYNLNFKKASFGEIVNTLSDYYSIYIRVGENIKNLKLTASFEGMSLGEAVDLIELTLEVRCNFQNDTLYISPLHP